MEYLEEHLHEWLGTELQGYGDDDYLVFDCPGQIELYNHVSAFKSFVNFLKNEGWSICVVYCLDVHFITETSKFIAGAMQVRASANAIAIKPMQVHRCSGDGMGHHAADVPV